MLCTLFPTKGEVAERNRDDLVCSALDFFGDSSTAKVQKKTVDETRARLGKHQREESESESEHTAEYEDCGSVVACKRGEGVGGALFAGTSLGEEGSVSTRKKKKKKLSRETKGLLRRQEVGDTGSLRSDSFVDCFQQRPMHFVTLTTSM